MKVGGQFLATYHVSITGKHKLVALTDGEVMGRIEELERKGFRIFELPNGMSSGRPGLAIAYDSDLSNVLVIVPIGSTETETCRHLLRAYDLHCMPVTARRQ